MRIAISVETDNELESIVAHHFGRCPFFALVDLDDREIKAVQVINNPFYHAHQPGQVPGFINEQNADVMLSGGMGGRAIDFFRQYGIITAAGASGTVRNALKEYLGGEMSGAAPCKESLDHGH